MIQRTHRESNLEKRLKLLESQLYGKKEKLDVRSQKIEKQVGNWKLDSQTSILKSQYPASNVKHPTSNSDVTYLRQDLLKIALLSSLTIGFIVISSLFVDRINFP